ncbi:MAG: glycoside hydrolase family 97 protein [Allosphingosinicella sp.]|uniref:glycoside hydrolase family 97 protein n=1 Tax=Allosphingosinicella sp. TaxID=2823234 RepID=UPI00395E3C2B
MLPRLIILAAAMLFSFAPAAAAEPVAQISSPGGVISLAVEIDNDGRPSYSVRRFGTLLIAPSRLGFMLLDAPKLERGFVLASQSSASFDETWEQPWGERRFVRNRHNELRVRLSERAGLQRSMDVVFRVFDNGVGFRYEFPDQPNLADVQIQDELTEFAIAQPGTAWWIPAFEWNREEYLYNTTAITEVGIAQTPMTVRTANGVHIAFHEAALVDYSGMNLASMGHGRFRAALTPGTDGAKVRRRAPFPTPWRTMQIADSAGGLVMNDLILNLNEPNRLGDVSWVQPFKYVGVWWEMHLDLKSWASGPRHGATNDNIRRHIDFAARHGFRGVLVEGWNVGWDGDWFGTGFDFNFTQPYPGVDLEGLAAYARSKGVRLVGHHETGGNAAHYEAQMEDAFDYYRRLGIDAVKTGYVADAGQARIRDEGGTVRFAWHEGQEMARHHQRVIDAAARRRISINAHEPIKDTGLRRTYPNIISREGARGMEFSAWGDPSNPPEHESVLVFTRMLAGPMDYTPGIFGMRTRSPQGVQTTWAKQLALYVVIYSPIQMVADLLDNYEANPGPFQFIKDVPVDWEESVVVNGEIGDFVTIARKERGGENWYLGAVTDEEGRVLSAPLSFLTPGRRYRAQIYRDGDTAHYRDNPGDVAIEERIVTSADTLTLRLAPGGGQAIRLVAMAPGERGRRARH